MGSVAAVVEAVADCVRSRYVDEGSGARAAAALRRKLGEGGYDDVAYAAPLAALLTEDLQAALPDLHLQVRWSAEPRAESTTSHWDDPAFLADYWAREALDNHGFDKVQRLPGNVGLMVVRGIDEPEGTAPVVDAAFSFLARCRALIIDLRRTTGGAASGVAYLLGHLLPPNTPLVELRDRAGTVLERTRTAPDGQPTFGSDVPVFVLTGRRTVSACEELAYDLRAAGRATLVGAPTAGAANPVDVYTVDPHVAVRVPTAVVRHALTGSNWEGAGIVPDVACAIDDALDVAHRLAVDDVRLQVDSGRVVRAEALLEEIDDARRALDEQLGRR